ncbi:hypothetical protein LWI29_009682 [Acer saccharum]|uniref:CCHC-type domain-containing protein n=1 Tax=Acer saccharum TaxID=4024 RepID=A0AA39TJT5_ACESA|nr:hypothetical protein LWI29_009682 [Acer saccharum]
MEEAFLAKNKGKHQGKGNQKKPDFNNKNGDNKGKGKGKGKMDATSSESSPTAKFPSCTTCKRTNHLAKDCWYKGKPQVQCTFCKKWGHIKQYCRAKQSQQTQQPMQQANYTDDHVTDDHLFMMSQACMAASTDTWK